MKLAKIETESALLETTASKMQAETKIVTVIEANKGLQLVDCRELFAYRDLFRFLIWRQVMLSSSAVAVTFVNFCIGMACLMLLMLAFGRMRSLQVGFLFDLVMITFAAGEYRN